MLELFIMNSVIMKINRTNTIKRFSSTLRRNQCQPKMIIKPVEESSFCWLTLANVVFTGITITLVSYDCIVPNRGTETVYKSRTPKDKEET